MKFPYLLFDADDTLFDFPKAAARAFSAMCRSNGVPDTLDTRASTTGSTRSCGQPLTGERSPRTM